MIWKNKEITGTQAKIIKKFLHDSYNQGKSYFHPSLQTCSRIMGNRRNAYDVDEYEYGFLSQRTDLTDDEVAEMVEDMTLRIFSLYDCTGKRFTKWIHTHRNPDGRVSFVHVTGLDI